MRTSSSAKAPRGAAGGVCRRPRRADQQRAEWVRPYKRAQRALDASKSLILTAFHTVVYAGRCGENRPLQVVKRLDRGRHDLSTAAARLAAAKGELARARECLLAAPQHLAGDAREYLAMAAERCEQVDKYILLIALELMEAQTDVLARLMTGEYMPEPPDPGRPRIVIKPRLAAIRAFLSSRLPRVSERITPLLLRRRRTPRPAEVRVPKRAVLGRAPPFSSTCSL